MAIFLLFIFCSQLVITSINCPFLFILNALLQFANLHCHMCLFELFCLWWLQKMCDALEGGGSRSKFPWPGSKEGPAKSLIQTGELNDILVGLKPSLAPASLLLHRGPCYNNKLVHPEGRELCCPLVPLSSTYRE